MPLITSIPGVDASRLSQQMREALQGTNQNGEKVRAYENIPYSSIRGLIAPKEFTSEDEILLFQFNPEQIADQKNVEWSAKGYTGFSSQDYYWVKGSERSLSFTLFFDATASANTKLFGKNTAYGNAGFDTLADVFPHGTMDMVDKLTSFQYPMQDDPNKPRYSSGLAVPNVRFMPPPIAIFVFGDMYLECVVADVNPKHTLFDINLQPRRTECDVTLKVIETSVVKIDSRLTNNKVTDISALFQRRPV